ISGKCPVRSNWNIRCPQIRTRSKKLRSASSTARMRSSHRGNEMSNKRLGIGIIGSGFNARFHMQAFVGVRDADIRGVWSPTEANAVDAVKLVHVLDIGEAKVFRSIAEMVADPAIDAIWLCGPNHTRVENIDEIVNAIERGRGTLKGIACEKPLARN